MNVQSKAVPFATSEKRIGSVIGPALSVAALTVLTFGGYFKGSKYLEWVPFDISLAAGVVVLFLLVNRIFELGIVRSSTMGLLPAVFFTFIIGIPQRPWNSYTDSKLIYVFAVTPLCVSAGMYLLRSSQVRRFWVYANIVLGFAIYGLALIDPAISKSGRFYADGGNTIGTGRATGAALTVLVILVIAGWHRYLCALGAAAMLFGTLQAESRGPVLAAAVAVLLVAALSPGRGRGRRSLLVGTAVVVIGYVLLDAGQVANRLTTFDDDSSGVRRTLWHRTWVLTQEHPLGIGWGNLFNNMPAYENLKSGFVQYPHNMLLEISSEAGWLAALAVIGLLFVSLRRQAIAASHWTDMAMLGLLIFHIFNAMVSGDMSSNRGVWVQIGAALALQSAKHLTAKSPPLKSNPLDPAAVSHLVRVKH